ncbi:hypothetical protein Leryth_019299 [Lithospermum erythrorhizon]|nr:hypothetical protein Leryth_019299 [Lithospermum erythrorhizon]
MVVCMMVSGRKGGLMVEGYLAGLRALHMKDNSRMDMNSEGPPETQPAMPHMGTWLFDMKHGKGTMSYANGNCYEGEWGRDKPDGQGSYEWSNGNKYIGKWKQGKMNGNGTMTWANGNGMMDVGWMVYQRGMANGVRIKRSKMGHTILQVQI